MLKSYFSPGRDICNAIIHLLAHAEKSIDICVFTISDDDISKVIINAHRRGIYVRILTDNDKLFDRGSDVDAFISEGIEVKTDHSPNHMHHKFALIDDRYFLTGSYNWTRSAAKYNNENIIIGDDKETINRYRAEFERLWRKW